MLNPRPRIEALALPGGGTALVVDDALLEPGRWREIAQRTAAAFKPDPLAGYPVQRLPLPGPLVAPFGVFFTEFLRSRFGYRRVLDARAWLALCTGAPVAPVRASTSVAGQGIVLAELFLSEDPAMGGLVFPTAPLLDDAAAVRVPAKFNRLVVFDGACWHAPDIADPGCLSGDPATGRLMIEARFTCRRRAS